MDEKRLNLSRALRGALDTGDWTVDSKQKGSTGRLFSSNERQFDKNIYEQFDDNLIKTYEQFDDDDGLTRQV